jgi:nucleoside-diphosphate-sugar epimerase
MKYQGSYSIFNISTGEGHSILEIVNILTEVMEKKPQLTFRAARGFDVPANILSSQRLREETGWQPRITLKEGIGRYIRWLNKYGKV